MPDLWAAPYMARIHPSMRRSLTTVTPTTLLYSFFSFSPQSKIHRTIVVLTFFKTKYPKLFLGPFPGTQGLLPFIFEFPYSRCISSSFF